MLKLGHFGSGAVSTSYTKNIVFYNRTLNAKEMLAWNKKYGDASIFNPVKPEMELKNFQS